MELEHFRVSFPKESLMELSVALKKSHNEDNENFC